MKEKASKQGNKYIGNIKLTSKGTGYVEINDGKDELMIDLIDLNTALNNDEVELTLTGKKMFGKKTAFVTKILRRAKTNFVGQLYKKENSYYLTPDDKKLYKDILILPCDALMSNVGLKVLIEFIEWNNNEAYPKGKYLKTVGQKGEHNAEMLGIVFEKGFDIDFPLEVENEAKEIEADFTPSSSLELSGRRDFRNTLTFTIDPFDAKDFDDAISFKNLESGEYEIGVHIADVSHFVLEKSSLDKEARKRGFSVYLVDRTIPMLPESLSNNICSLNPGVDRFTFSAVFKIDELGNVKDRWFGKTIIHSAKRFTYEEAQDVIDGKLNLHREELLTLNKIAAKLRAKKYKNGAIDFEQDEFKFELDELGKPLRIIRKQRLDTHKLVEEYMLLANKEVAEFIYKAREKSKSYEPFIYRIHDIPNQEKIAELGIFLKALGHDLPDTHGKITAKDLQALFKKIEGRAEESMIKTATIRSMAKAIYSTSNIGHFGLAFEYYTHFTSPIRRYADLLVHRLLFSHLTGAKIPKHEWSLYEKMAHDNSEHEIAAAEAERASKKYKQVEYMQTKIGQTFYGVISGVTDWGIYIEEKNTGCEGMVKLRDLDDYYNLDEKNYCLIGEKTHKKYSLGDEVKFLVTNADIEKRTLDFKLVN